MNILKQIHELSEQLEVKQKAKAISIIGMELLVETDSTEMEFTMQKGGMNIKCAFAVTEAEGENNG